MYVLAYYVFYHQFICSMAKIMEKRDNSEKKRQKELNKIPDVNHLKQGFKSHLILSIFLLTLLFLLNILLFYIVYYTGTTNNFTILFPIILLLIQLRESYSFIIKPKTEINKVHKEKIGNFDIKEIQNIIKEVIKPGKEKRQEIPNFYIIKSNEADVFTVDLLFLNFIKPLNAIYIPTSILYILTPHELKSIIAHEMAHFRYYMHLPQRTVLIIDIFISLFPVLLLKINHLASEWYAFIIGFMLYYILRIIFGIVFMKKMKNIEYLSDYYAAVKYGKIDLINALITITRTVEMSVLLYNIILSHIKRSNNISLAHISRIIEIIEESLQNKLLSKKELKKYVLNAFKSDDIQTLKEVLSDTEIEERNKQIKTCLSTLNGSEKNKLLDWDLFDFDKKDHKINNTEYPYLINALLDNPKKQLFDIILDNVKANEYGTHPTIRERILFLHKNIE